MAPPLTGSSLIPIRQPKDRGSMKRLLCSLLVAAVPFGGALADAPKSKNAKVTLVYQHELPNVPRTRNASKAARPHRQVSGQRNHLSGQPWRGPFCRVRTWKGNSQGEAEHQRWGNSPD